MPAKTTRKYINLSVDELVIGNGEFTLPTVDGLVGQIIVTDGAGNLTWQSPGGTGTVTSITAGTGLNGGTITASGTIDLANTAVIPGSYTGADITVDAQGRITAATNGSSGSGTVTSIDATLGGTAITISGVPITTAGTIAFAYNGTAADYIDGAGDFQSFPSIPVLPTNIVETVTTTDGSFIELTPNAPIDGAVTITADLSATGTTDATTFLRGDNTWATPPSGAGDLISTNNLSDVANAVTSLSNLGGEPSFAKNTAFNKDFGTTAGTVLEGDKNAAIVLNTAKVGITPTQASDITTNNAKVGITPTQASDITTNNAKVSNVSTNLSLGPISATSMDINSSDGTNVTLTDADATFAGVMPAAKFNEVVANNAKVGITPTQASDITTNNAKITNATHTGEVTGSGALTVDPTAISNKASVTPAAGMEVLVNDAGTLKKANVSDFLGGGSVFTPTINSTNMVEVSQESDFGAATGGVITLTANTTYFVRGSVAITNEILINSGNAIVGFNRDIDKLIYSGSTNLLTVVDNDFSIRNIGLKATNATGKILDATNITVATATNNGRTKVLELQNLKIENTTNVWTIRGFELVDVSNCLIWYIVDGTIGCQFQSNRHLEISSCEFYNWFEEGTPANLDFYRQIEILANFTPGVGNGVININASIIHPEFDQIGLYVEPTSTTGFGTIASNTFTNTNLTPNIHQETVTLTGTSGTANVLIGTFQPYLATFNADLTTTASDFVTAYAQELAFRFGITLTSSGADIIFTASIAGNIFSVTSTTNVSGDLSGTGLINTAIDGVLADLETNSQKSFIIQGNQGLENANALGGLIIQDNTNAFSAPTSYQTLNATNVGGSFTISPYFPKARRVITDRDACSITYDNKNSGAFFVAVNATVDGNNGFVTCRLKFTRGGVTTSVPFATGVVELRGSAETLSFTTLGQTQPGDIFEVEFLKSTGNLTVTDFTLNGHQF